MDVRIGSIDATVVDSGSGAEDHGQIDRIARRVLVLMAQQQLREERGKNDRKIGAPDGDDVTGYG